MRKLGVRGAGRPAGRLPVPAWRPAALAILVLGLPALAPAQTGGLGAGPGGARGPAAASPAGSAPAAAPAPPGAAMPQAPVPGLPPPADGLRNALSSLGIGGEAGSGARSAAGPGGGSEDLLRALAGSEPGRLSVPLRILALLTVLTLVPSIILLTTCFPRIVIVLSFVRRAIGTQELPPNQVLIGLALFLTAMVMAPVWEQIRTQALVPYQEKRIGEEEAVRNALLPLKRFMLDRTLRSDLRLFLDLSRYREEAARKGVSAEQPLTELPITVVVPAFILSELKTAFQMGFVLYLPFVIIDLLISTVLISMGMLVLPPILISLPLKVLVFVLVDGWRLIVQELVKSFV